MLIAEVEVTQKENNIQNIFLMINCEKRWSCVTIERTLTLIHEVPYILESNAHPNLIRTQFLATS
jgi:hypothetical protein